MERDAQGTPLKKVCNKTMAMMIEILPMKLRIMSICWRQSHQMGICAIHNYNFNKIEWNSGHMLKWLCTNNGIFYMMKWNISAYNKRSYHTCSRGAFFVYFENIFKFLYSSIYALLWVWIAPRIMHYISFALHFICITFHLHYISFAFKNHATSAQNA